MSGKRKKKPKSDVQKGISYGKHETGSRASPESEFDEMDARFVTTIASAISLPCQSSGVSLVQGVCEGGDPLYAVLNCKKCAMVWNQRGQHGELPIHQLCLA